MRNLLFWLMLLSQAVSGQFTDLTVIKEVRTAGKGVVVSAHPLASEAGASILRQGGNAFDAAIATQFALAVVYPQAGNLGGGGFLVGVKSTGEKFTLDFRETAPAKASRDMYLRKNGQADTDLSQNGHLAAGVPGSVAGFFSTLKHAKLKMTQLIQPAIELAEQGFALTAKEAALLNSHQADFKKHNKIPTVFQKATAWKAGDLLIQKELAATLKRIQADGAAGFYGGAIAKLIVEEISRGNGIITAKDLADYRVAERKPLNFPYRDTEIVSMPLPSSGGLLLAQMLGMSSRQDLSQFAHNSPEAVQIMVEAERRAFADRAEFMGDPAFIDDKTDLLMSEKYLKKRWENYSAERATPSVAVGKIIPQPKESTETTHISILDKEGNAVAVTTTLNGLYGSKVVVAGAGFFLNNEMDDFSVKPGVPNMFGAVGGEANSIQPGKRMLSSMTPTILLKNGKPFIVVGTPGGTTIPTSVYQTVVNLLDFNLSPNLAVNAPKFHHQWLPETVIIEEGFPDWTVKNLEKKNYEFTKTAQIGRTELIIRNDDGSLTAVADGRGDDSVAVE